MSPVGRRALIAGTGIAILLGGVMWSLKKSNYSATPAQSSESVVSSGNDAHDRLLAMSPNELAIALGRASDSGCVGKDSFFAGMGPDRITYWDVRCFNGRGYRVSYEPNGDFKVSAFFEKAFGPAV